MRKLRRRGVSSRRGSFATLSRAPRNNVRAWTTRGVLATAGMRWKCESLEPFILAKTAELPSQACFSHGPISPMEACSGLVLEIAGIPCCSWLPPICGIVIPAAMSMPAMFMSPDSEDLLSARVEWQSVFMEAKAQERSQAAPSEDADSRSATIKPENMRLRII
jgi:hypothetical protein